MKNVYTTLLCSLVLSSGALIAQDLKQFRKPASEMSHPVAEPATPSVNLPNPELQAPAPGLLNDVPAYGEIHSPIRWYAIENENNDTYWQAVDCSRIWLELDLGRSLNARDIKAFLESHNLGEPVQQSRYKHVSNFYVFSLPGATPAEVVEMAKEARNIPGIQFLEPSVRYTRKSTPNDPLYPYQWGPQVINAEEAWEYTTGGSWNVIAVIDDAIDWNHPELYDQVWYGYDFGMDDNDPTPDDPSQNHGTHVTGTIAAKIGNNAGMAGMVNDTIYFAKVTDATYDPEEGNFSDVAIVDALYSISFQPRIGVVNMSLGGGAPSAAMEQACNANWNNNKILVVASGNESASTVSYPAAFNACMAVGSVGANGVNMYFAAYSNYGSAQEIVAPGGDQGAGYGILSTVLFNEFDAMEGTSMACPHVAGVAGLMKAANPALSNLDIRNILNTTATDYGTTGWDQVFGYGMVNAGLAVQTAVNFSSLGATEGSDKSRVSLYPNPCTDALNINSDGLQVQGAIEVYDLSGKMVFAQNSGQGDVQSIGVQHLPKGMYLVRLQHSEGATSARFVKQ